MRRLLLLCVTGALVAICAQAQAKVGIIDLQKAMLGTAEIKKAQADLEAKYKPRQEAMARLDKDIQGIQSQLQSMAGKLTQQAEADLQLQGTRKQRELQRMNDDLQADVDRERNDILQGAGRRMTDVIKKLAEEKSLDVVLDRTNTLYTKDALDITSEAIAAYDKTYPVK